MNTIYACFAFLLFLIGAPMIAQAKTCIAGDGTKMCAEIKDKNVLGKPLELCCEDPMTGFYRNGYCQTGVEDRGTHVACAKVTQEFLDFSKSRGNDLITPMPQYNFPGLEPGDKWCLCALRWTEALEANVAPPLYLEATHERMTEFIDMKTLKKHAAETEKTTDLSGPVSEPNAYQFSFTDIDGNDMPLNQFEGKVLLIVNTASQCGFTGQYEGLQDLYETYKDRGLVVIGVPCNQFAGQEPGDEQTIKDFAQQEYGITFPLTSKTEVLGDNRHPFFEWASEEKKGGFIFSKPRWNFHKYLIDRDGNLHKSFGSNTEPQSLKIIKEIEELL